MGVIIKKDTCNSNLDSFLSYVLGQSKCTCAKNACQFTCDRLQGNRKCN